MLKDIDPNFRRNSSLDSTIATREGTSALLLAMNDCIEEEIGEALFDTNQGINIQDYLNGSVNILNSIILKGLIYKAFANGLEGIIINDSDIQVLADFRDSVYRVYVKYSEDRYTEQKPLELVLKINR